MIAVLMRAGKETWYAAQVLRASREEPIAAILAKQSLLLGMTACMALKCPDRDLRSIFLSTALCGQRSHKYQRDYAACISDSRPACQTSHKLFGLRSREGSVSST